MEGVAVGNGIVVYVFELKTKLIKPKEIAIMKGFVVKILQMFYPFSNLIILGKSRGASQIEKNCIDKGIFYFRAL